MKVIYTHSILRTSIIIEDGVPPPSCRRRGEGRGEKMKKILSYLLTLFFFLFVAAAAVTYGSQTAKIIFNNQYLKTDVPPLIINGRVLVPLRAIGEALGVDISWDSNIDSVIISTEPDAQALTKEQLLEIAKPATVEITAVTHTEEDKSGVFMEYSTGTGFNIDPSGLIVTNSHVIANAKSISVRFPNGVTSDAGLIVDDKKKDLALLKLTSSSRTYPMMKLGNSDSLSIGERVVIIGNPEGAGLKVSEGMITDLSVKVTNLRIPLLEITADLHPGNSGSPVLDAQGRVIGIISVKIEKKGGSNVETPLGGAIPVNLLKEILP